MIDGPSKTVTTIYTGCACDCVNTGHNGENCETPEPCTAAADGRSGYLAIFCQNSGTVTGTTGNCGCDCAGTEFTGSNCQISNTCVSGGSEYTCENSGAGIGTTGSCGCDCSGTAFAGDTCENVGSCTTGAGAQPCQNSGVATGVLREWEECDGAEWTGTQAECEETTGSSATYVSGLTATDGCACDCTGTGFSGTNCETVGDSTKDGGGAIYASGVQLTIEDTEFVENKVDNLNVRDRSALKQGRGGGICAYKSTVTIKAGVFQRNMVNHEGLGGAIYGEDSTFEIQGTTFEDNSALSGGAIHVRASEDAGATCDVNVEQSEFIKNEAAHFGGAISLHFCTALISGSSFRENKASGSSAVRMMTRRTKVGDTYKNVQKVRDGIVRGGSGGAIHVFGSAVTVRTSTFYANEAISCNNFGADGINFGGFPIFDKRNSDSKLGFCCNSFHGQQSVDTCMLQSVVDEKAAAGTDIENADKFRSTCLSQGGLGGALLVEKSPLARGSHSGDSNLAVVATTFTDNAAAIGAAIHATSAAFSVEDAIFEVKNKFSGGVGEATMDDTANPGSQAVCDSGPGLVEGCEDTAETFDSMAMSVCRGI